mmetsp:Transcript_10351/g.10378  ORF Transcript_10351/g.10378 Transcript_10351/m.10378 type:complete len:90 (+) Transcript_10351:546-815(+)
MYQDYSQEVFQQSNLVLKGQKKICYENEEKLYLANSKDLIDLIVELNLEQFYPYLHLEKQSFAKNEEKKTSPSKLQVAYEQRIDRQTQV